MHYMNEDITLKSYNPYPQLTKSILEHAMVGFIRRQLFMRYNDPQYKMS